MVASLIRKPSAWIPVALSLAALILVTGHFALYGIMRETDEGAAAHIFQILMVLQIPFVAAFIIRELRTKPSDALKILAVQIVAGLAAIASVYFLT